MLLTHNINPEFSKLTSPWNGSSGRIHRRVAVLPPRVNLVAVLLKGIRDLRKCGDARRASD